MSLTIRHLLILSAALLALACSPVRSQQYSLQAYDRKDGLESQTINCLLQDHRGFIWACTEMGLYRFDGNRFERLGKEAGFEKGEYITALAQNPKSDQLWVATQSGLRVGDGLHFKNVEPDGKPLVVDIARALTPLDDGRLLLIRGGRLLVLAGSAGNSDWKLASFFNAAQLAIHPQLGTITAAFSTHGGLWLGCKDAICEIDQQGKIRVYGTTEGIPGDSWSGMLLDKQGALWVRGIHHVRVLLSGADDFIARDVPNHDMDVITDDARLVQGPGGKILTPVNHGLAQWDGTHWRVFDSSNGLPDIGITAALFDQGGTLWLGTYGRGIYRWSGYGVVEGWGPGQGLDSVPNWSILRDNQGLMWFGNELGGSVLTRGDSLLKPWPIRFTPASRQVLSLAKAPDGAVWAGLYDHRILRYDPATRLTTLAAELPSFVKALHFDRSGRLWIVTSNGIYHIDRLGAPAQHVLDTQAADSHCADISEDSKGALWFACNNGVIRFADGRWTLMRTSGASMASGFAAIAAGSDGSLWLGANEPGVFHATVNGDALVVSHNADPWLDQSLAYFVRRDQRGWIWVGGSGGADVYDGAHWTHISQDDGLISDESDQSAFFEDGDGSIWIGTAAGVSHILHPATLLSTDVHKVVITSVTHGARVVQDGDNVTIGGKHAPLILRYALLGRTTGTAPHFRYRLQGSEWIDTAAHVIVFSGLPFGDYRLEIQAIDDDHRTFSRSTYFRFVVATPWWLAWWTYPLEALLLVLIVLLSSRGRSRRLVRQNKQLEAMVTERTAELVREKSELERARADLYDQATHDGLTGLYNRMAVLGHLTEQLRHISQHPPGLAIALIDVDYFKRINDTYGHQAGDATLQNIARELQSYVRDDDRLGRYGGEEILMVVPGISRPDAENRLREIQSAVSATLHRWKDYQFRVTLSIGLVWIADETVSMEDLIRRADFALYEAKSGGRNRVVSEVSQIVG